MTSFKDILNMIKHSYYYHLKMKSYRHFINPNIHEIKKKIEHKLRKNAIDKVENQKKDLEKLLNSYDYKVKEHLAKTKFSNLNTYEKLKKCNFGFLNNFENSYHNYNYSFFKRVSSIKIYDFPNDYYSNIFYKLFLILSMIAFFKIGYYNSSQTNILYDYVKYNVKNIENENELTNILLTTNKPIAVLYYFPNTYNTSKMISNLGIIHDKHNTNDHLLFTAARVNCRHNLELCMRKADNLKFPQLELMFPPVEFSEEEYENTKNKKIQLEEHNELNDSFQHKKYKFPVIPSTMDRSFEGMEGFLMKENVIFDRYNPILILRKGSDLLKDNKIYY